MWAEGVGRRQPGGQGTGLPCGIRTASDGETSRAPSRVAAV